MTGLGRVVALAGGHHGFLIPRPADLSEICAGRLNRPSVEADCVGCST
jgi:hypothetical protein